LDDVTFYEKVAFRELCDGWCCCRLPDISKCSWYWVVVDAVCSWYLMNL
jgi:hypothetical protein